MEFTNEKITSELKQLIDDIKQKRKDRPIPKAGFKYRRDWVDIMEDNNELNVDFLFGNNLPKSSTNFLIVGSIFASNIFSVSYSVFLNTLPPSVRYISFKRLIKDTIKYFCYKYVKYLN
jgi:hypothetical protein